jgi:hypothetical protein
VNVTFFPRLINFERSGKAHLQNYRFLVDWLTLRMLTARYHFCWRGRLRR